MSKAPKKYEIDSFEKLINVASTENFERLSRDMLIWLHYTITAIETIRKKYPKDYKGKTNSEVVKSTFIWIDDGLNKLLSVHIKDPKTGEITEVELEQKKDT